MVSFHMVIQDENTGLCHEIQCFRVKKNNMDSFLLPVMSLRQKLTVSVWCYYFESL